MYPLTEHYPKCILSICNKPLIVYQLEMLAELGIRDVTIVVGHYGSAVAQTTGNGEQYGLNVTYVDQGEALGSAHALGRLEHNIKDPFVLFLGDIFLGNASLSLMVDAFRRNNVNAMLGTRIEQDAKAFSRNFAIIEDNSGSVKQVIEKPQRSTSKVKGCGIYVFDHHIFDAIRRTPRTAIRDEYELTDSIQILIDDGLHVAHASVIEEDFNLTYACELLYLNMSQLRRLHQRRIIDKNSVVPNPELLEYSVVGEGVTLHEGVPVRNSVIFANTVVDSVEPIENAIVTPENSVYCRPFAHVG